MHANRQMMASTMGDLTPAQAPYMRVLAEHPDLSQRDLAEALHLSPPSITAMVQKMAREGLVERYADQTDQRLMRIKLTKLGHTIDKRLRAAHVEYMKAALGPMSQEDRSELKRLLNVVADNIEGSRTEDR